MPFVYDESDIEWSDEDPEPPRPRADQFQYLRAREFGGEAEPVRFSVPPLRDRSARSTTKPLALEDVDATTSQLLAVMVPALREVGVRRLYCRYDGGHDEGFAWLDRADMQDGRRIDTDALVRRLGDIRAQDRLLSAGVVWSGTSMHEVIHDWLVLEWASMLLGGGFGTGEYSMYGAFTVDLDACTINDDPNAEAIVRNISIDEGGR